MSKDKLVADVLNSLSEVKKQRFYDIFLYFSGSFSEADVREALEVSVANGDAEKYEQCDDEFYLKKSSDPFCGI